MSHTNSSKNIEKSCIYFSKTFSVSPRSGTQKRKWIYHVIPLRGDFFYLFLRPSLPSPYRTRGREGGGHGIGGLAFDWKD